MNKVLIGALLLSVVGSCFAMPAGANTSQEPGGRPRGGGSHAYPSCVGTPQPCPIPVPYPPGPSPTGGGHD